MTTVNAGRANDHRFQTHKTATLLKPSNADMNKPTPRCTTCRIKNKSLLHNCQPDLLEELSDSKLIQSFKKGERLITEGEEARAVYCVRSGVAKAEMHDSQDKTLLLRLEGEGSILGYRVSGKKDKQPLTLTAVENMQVCRIPIEQFRGMTAKSQALRSEIMKHLLAEVHEAESRALTLACHSVKERVAGALLHIATLYQYQQNGCSIHVHLNRQDMAELAGTTKEQVSAVLADLRKERLVLFKAKHFKFFDLPGLKQLAKV